MTNHLILDFSSVDRSPVDLTICKNCRNLFRSNRSSLFSWEIVCFFPKKKKIPFLKFNKPIKVLKKSTKIGPYEHYWLIRQLMSPSLFDKPLLKVL